jgi:hypothetical protein
VSVAGYEMGKWINISYYFLNSILCTPHNESTFISLGSHLSFSLYSSNVEIPTVDLSVVQSHENARLLLNPEQNEELAVSC